MNTQSERNWITAPAFDHIGYTSHHGINIPLSAIRTKNSCGIGEYLDLLPLVDWCADIGFDTIQLLPLNDTGKETSPYNALTSCGLNPIFLSLRFLPHTSKPESFVVFNKFKRLSRTPYESVLHEKISFLQDYYREYFSLFAVQKEYLHFLETNNEWLSSYALFKVLKTRYMHENWQHWPNGLDSPSTRQLKVLYREEEEMMNFYKFLQYLCYDQLKTVKTYANKKNVLLKGDIPILINTQSADVWISKTEFNTDFSVGAPPDQFTKEGQNWGFPVYNWEVIRRDSFQWWKKRLIYAKNFYDIYRLDHIIGLFRFWVIPKGEKATEGSFIPSESWAAELQGRQILEAILPTTDMLPIGEDLGANIENIQSIMQQIGVPGTRIMRWMRYHQTNNAFIPYDQYPSLALTSVSTHDSETLTLWWEQYPQEAEEFCQFRNLSFTPKLTPETRAILLKDSHHTPTLFHINLLGEYLAMFEDLVWLNPEEERINLPGTIQATNWTYRLRPSLEEVLRHKELKSFMRSLLN